MLLIGSAWEPGWLPTRSAARPTTGVQAQLPRRGRHLYAVAHPVLQKPRGDFLSEGKRGEEAAHSDFVVQPEIGSVRLSALSVKVAGCEGSRERQPGRAPPPGPLYSTPQLLGDIVADRDAKGRCYWRMDGTQDIGAILFVLLVSTRPLACRHRPGEEVRSINPNARRQENEALETPEGFSPCVQQQHGWCTASP